METTRHFTSTVYIVNDGATALHEHKRLGIRLPPGGHVNRDELPHEAAIREIREETGLEAELLAEVPDVAAPDGRPLPTPRYQMLYDINVHENGSVGHQHIDHIFFARVPSRGIDPVDGEVSKDAWTWYDREDLRRADLSPGVVQLGLEAIEATDR